MSKPSLTTYISFVATLLVSLLILADFFIPGTTHHQEITRVEKARQQYYNAAGNSHYSFRVISPTHSFPVSESLGTALYSGDSISFQTSPVFAQINWSQTQASEQKHRHSLRLFSGLILPLLCIILITLIHRKGWKADTFIFVLQVMLVADLVYLLY